MEAVVKLPPGFWSGGLLHKEVGWMWHRIEKQLQSRQPAERKKQVRKPPGE